MLKALCTTTGQYLSADDLTSDDTYRKTLKFVCPITKADVFYVRSYHRQNDIFVNAHFKSKKREREEVPSYVLWDGDLFEEKSNKIYCNESIRHQEGKREVKKYCEEMFASYNSQIEYEYVVKLPTGKWRIIDVAVIHPNGIIDAHEVQLCRITPDQLEERSHDYRTQNINSYWYFGGNANTSENIEWYFESFGRMPAKLNFVPY